MPTVIRTRPLNFALTWRRIVVSSAFTAVTVIILAILVAVFLAIHASPYNAALSFDTETTFVWNSSK
jgi:hypothetical protein